MTHEPESEFADRVLEHLREQFGADVVTEQVYLEESDRFVDVVVDVGIVTLCIEIESEFDRAITGVGQAILYAAHYVDGVPVVVVPPDHLEDPEAVYLSRQVPIVPLDV